jgi:RNA polymerase sigma factor (sigma-70 family)
MTSPSAHRVFTRINHLLTYRPFDGLTDRELLQRFHRERDRDAFTVLVSRHAPMVLGVCRRVLRHEQDAEDVCQATFLTLARKAGSRNWRDSVAPWLYRVAFHLALRLRRNRLREGVSTQPALNSTETDPLAVVSGRELCFVLDEELRRLSDVYRSALVLCCLEGLTRDEAAHRLGWSLGTLKRRLEHGRALLRQRLERRGYTLPTVLTAGLFAAGSADAGLPAGLAQSIVRGAVIRATAGYANASRFKLVAAILLTACIAGTGIGLAWQPAGTDAEPAARSSEEPPRPEDQRKADAKPAAKVDRFGDPLPLGAIARLNTERFRLPGSASELSYSTDGRVLTTRLGSVTREWDVASGRELPGRRLEADLALIDCRKFIHSPDGTVVLISGSKPIRFWDTATRQEIYPLGKTTLIAGDAAITRDGALLATIDYPGVGITIWDLKQGQKADGFLTSLIYGDVSMAFSPDGSLLAYPLPKGVGVWDVKAKRQVASFDLGTFPPIEVVFSPDSKFLAATDPFTPRGGTRQVHVWNARTGEKIGHWQERGDPYHLAFSPDGKLLASGGRFGHISLRETATGKERWHGIAHTFGVTALAFSPDGRQLASGGQGGVIRLWDVANGKETRPYNSPVDGVDWVSFTPDGASIVSSSADQVAVWQARTGKLLRVFDDDPAEWSLPPALSPDGKTLAHISGSKGRIHLWDLARGQSRSIQDEGVRTYETKFAPDGKSLATVGWTLPAVPSQPPTRLGPDLQLRDVTTGKLVREIQIKYGSFSIAFGTAGDVFAITTQNDNSSPFQLHKWCTTDGKEEWQCPLDGFSYTAQLTVAPDGRTLAISGGLNASLAEPRFIELRDTTRGKLRRRIDCAGRSIAFSADSRMLVTAGPDNIARLWEVATGKERFHLQGTAVNFVRLSPDCKLLASVGQDAGLVWDITFRDGQLQGRRVPDRDLDQLWTDLSGDDASKAYRAIWTLAGSPDNAAPFLQKHIQTLLGPVDAKQVLDRLTPTTLLQADRAVEALERMDGEAARLALQDVAARARLTSLESSAAASLQRSMQRVTTPGH